MSSAMIPVPMAAAAQQLRSTQAHIGRCQVPAASQRLPARRERAFQRVSAVVGAGDRSEESRRQFLKIGSGVVDAGAGSASASAQKAAAPPAAASKAGPAEYKQVADETLAYSFKYPVATDTGRTLSWVPTRGPSAYSSAAPLSPDARQRIVFEVVNLKGPLTVTVTVGPPPPVLGARVPCHPPAHAAQRSLPRGGSLGRLRTASRAHRRLTNHTAVTLSARAESVGAPETWTPKQIAVAVLADRSTGRITSGQRISLAKVESARKKTIDSLDYIYWDSVTRGSPNATDGEAETYRRSIGATTFRDGYFYTFSTTANDRVWDEVEPVFLEAVKSFRLETPGKKFLKPSEEGLGLFGL